MFLHKKKDNRHMVVLSIAALLLLAGVLTLLFLWVRTSGPAYLVQSNVVKDRVTESYGEQGASLLNLMPELLGIPDQKTYLLLFQNNTEMRPSGGFIGSYALVNVHNTHVEVVLAEGSENLDKKAPADWVVEPPSILTQELGVDRWYFRDSNWSPDFAESAKQALTFYTAEGGVQAQDVDVVVGITPTVLEELLEVTGPITVQGITFKSEDVTEVLEYEVEFGYKERGIAVENRKAIIQELFGELLTRIKKDFLKNYSQFASRANNLVKQGHVQMYAVDDMLQKEFERANIAGRVMQTEGDYLMWVDANLAALKTDHAIERSLEYRMEKVNLPEAGTVNYVGEATMTYEHTGTFDWRTSRYRTYARVFVPKDAYLMNISINGEIDPSSQHDEGEELGKQWFGTFITLEPGETKKISFLYVLPEAFREQVEQQKSYTLFVQKQAGTIEPGLTLDLDFDIPVQSAQPGEFEERWGDNRYEYETTLLTNRAFSVQF